jgi:uncharacterized membrane protein
MPIVPFSLPSMLDVALAALLAAGWRLSAHSAETVAAKKQASKTGRCFGASINGETSIGGP